MVRALLNNSKVSTRKQLCGLDVRELLQWKSSKVAFLSRFKELQAIWIPISPFVFNQALHTTHHPLMERLKEIREVRGEEAAEQHKAASRVPETTGISSVTLKTEHSRRDSWARVSGIEPILALPVENRLRSHILSCYIKVLGNRNALAQYHSVALSRAARGR